MIDLVGLFGAAGRPWFRRSRENCAEWPGKFAETLPGTGFDVPFVRRYNHQHGIRLVH